MEFMSAVLNVMNETSEPHSDRSQSERAVVCALPSLMPFRSGYAVGLGGLTGSAVSGVLPEGCLLYTLDAADALTRGCHGVGRPRIARWR
mgnify:CR=1 FL=1